jgi:beta-glucosidase
MASKTPLTSYSFPKDFLWGASTAGHQVEGGNYDQWTAWELAHAAELADTAAERLRWLPDWMKFKKNAENPDNYVSGKGVDHLRRYKEDFRIAKKIGLNAFRFGIEWSRLEPDKGVWDKKAIDHYHNYIAALKAENIEPIINLWHWTHPVWFEEMGGFSKARNLDRYLRFVEKVAEEFGADITYVLTINEPNVYASFSYMTGEWPPQQQNPIRGIWTFYNLARAHRKAYSLLKKLHPHLQVGIATQFTNAVPKRPNHWLDKKVAKFASYSWNWWFVNRIKHHQDFVGFNYYFTDYYQGFKRVNPTKPHNDLGWYMEPSGLADVIVHAYMRYRKPILITENGVADSDDKYRKWWLSESMQAIATARKGGAVVIGYLHWSLLDNFEWKYGWWPKFGLIKVDRDRNMKRIIRPSAIWWSKELDKLKSES